MLDHALKNRDRRLAPAQLPGRSADRSEPFPGSQPATTTERQRSHLLVVIDHREARIFRTELQGTIPERIVPFDPHGFGRHLRYVEDNSNGKRKPEQRSFYEAVARSLRGAGQILLFGTGTGASSAMEQLLAELQHHHADLARRVVGSVAVDENHMTENQLLARARHFYHSMESAAVA